MNRRLEALRTLAERGATDGEREAARRALGIQQAVAEKLPASGLVHYAHMSCAELERLLVALAGAAALRETRVEMQGMTRKERRAHLDAAIVKVNHGRPPVRFRPAEARPVSRPVTNPRKP